MRTNTGIRLLLPSDFEPACAVWFSSENGKCCLAGGVCGLEDYNTLSFRSYTLLIVGMRVSNCQCGAHL